MAQAGQELEGPGGFRLRLIRSGAETGGELLEMEAHYTGVGGMPPEHYHPSQQERFEVMEGAVRAVIDGHAYRYEVGDAFQVPAGTPHQMAGDGHARVRWEVRPALRMAEFFERLYAAIAAGGEDVPDVLREFEDEVRFTPSTRVA
jgi:quercetin dioxygenase-like cupin family protein